MAEASGEEEEMAVRVRLFAALREAAGQDEVWVASDQLPQILDGLARRFGEPFATRLRLASVLVDGSACPRDADVVVPDGAELALLPPVSGGQSSTGQPGRWR